MRKNLVIISSYLPNTKKEVFYYNEFVKIVPSFKNISLIYHYDLLDTDVIKKKYDSYKVKYLPSKFATLFGLRFLLKPEVFKEVYVLLKKNQSTINSFIALIGSFASANLIAKRLALLIAERNFKVEETTFFSYWNNNSALALALLKKDFPKLNCVSRAHGYDVYEERNDFYYLPFRSLIFSGLDKILFISNHGMQYSIKKFGKYSSFGVVKIGVDVNTQSKPRIAKEKMLIVSCSNLVPVKRVDRIITLLAQIKEEQVEWVHFGGGILKDQLKELAFNVLEEKDNIKFRFRGEITNSDILKYYAESKVDCFINLSESEGIPVSIMEAMAYGIPVIATNVGGVAEIVSDKKNGYLINESELDDFNIETAIIEIKKNRSSLSSMAQKIVQKNHNVKKTISSLVVSLKNTKPF